MFWTKLQLQVTIEGDVVCVGTETVSQLLLFAETEWPDQHQEFWRRFAFLTHPATVTFLRTMLIDKYGSLDAAKEPTMNWLARIGSFETFSRGTRDDESVAKQRGPTGKQVRHVPLWYAEYLATDRWQSVKRQAEQWWRSTIGELSCIDNSRHPYEEMHHRDYGRLGSDNEYRFLVPKCRACHETIRLVGPSLPQECPEAVQRWL